MDEVGRELGQAAAAQQTQGAVQFGTQDVNGMRRSRPLAGGQAVKAGTANQHTTGAKQECLGNIAATAKAAIEKYLHLSSADARHFR